MKSLYSHTFDPEAFCYTGAALAIKALDPIETEISKGDKVKFNNVELEVDFENGGYAICKTIIDGIKKFELFHVDELALVN